MTSWRHSTHSDSGDALGHVSIVSHFYQIYFGFLGSNLILGCGLRDHVIMRFASSLVCINFYAREGEVKSAYFTNKPMILLVYKETYFNTNDLDHIVPSAIVSLL